jgi:hypothetical protein
MKDMTNVTSLTYTIKNVDNIVTKEMEFKGYQKNKTDEENMLLYKHIVRDGDVFESFNKMHKTPHELNEMIGNSKNRTKWNIHEYKNSMLSRKYRSKYDSMDFRSMMQINDIDGDEFVDHFYSNKTKQSKFIEDLKDKTE